VRRFAIFVALVALVFAASAVFAQASGSVVVAGKSDSSFDLVLPGDYEGVLDDTSGVSTSWDVGDVVVRSNHRNWTLEIVSSHAGNLTQTEDSAERIPYTFSLEGETGNFLVTDQSLSTAWTSHAQNKTPKKGRVYRFSIRFRPSETDFWQVGSYSDSLTFTIRYP